MSAPREYPILFSGPMVRALLDGTKTMTRRVVTDRNSVGNYKASELLLADPRTFVDDGFRAHGSKRDYLHAPVNAPVIEARRGWSPGDCDPSIMSRLYPVWEPGSLLWVRETWQYADWTEEGEPFVRYAADDTVRFCEGADEGERLVEVWAELSATANYAIDNTAADRRWRPSIHMPRWASRITLGLTDVRVQRVQEISDPDSLDEGIPYPNVITGAIGRFRTLWDSINAKRGYGWDANPFVWVLSFRRV